MNTLERISFIATIAKKDPNIGKTGIMKLLYLLQAIYKVPLDYEFEIYTYGPYSQTVMSDIEYAVFAGYINMSSVTYSSAMSGYRITAGNNSAQLLERESDVLRNYDTQITAIVDFFGNKSARELELYSTIVFVELSFSSNDWEKSEKEICSLVKKIKPHFSFESIETAYEDLASNRFFD